MKARKIAAGANILIVIIAAFGCGQSAAVKPPADIPVAHDEPSLVGPADPAADPVPVIPLSCADLSGTYQLKKARLEVRQTGCARIELAYQTAGAAPESTETLDTDSIERVETADAAPGEKLMKKAYFEPEKNDLVVEYRRLAEDGTAGAGSREIYLISSHPCQLANPKGSYLVKETYADGENQPSACVFWKKR